MHFPFVSLGDASVQEGCKYGRVSAHKKSRRCDMLQSWTKLVKKPKTNREKTLVHYFASVKPPENNIDTGNGVEIWSIVCLKLKALGRVIFLRVLPIIEGGPWNCPPRGKFRKCKYSEMQSGAFWTLNLFSLPPWGPENIHHYRLLLH